MRNLIYKLMYAISHWLIECTTNLTAVCEVCGGEAKGNELPTPDWDEEDVWLTQIWCDRCIMNHEENAA